MTSQRSRFDNWILEKKNKDNFIFISILRKYDKVLALIPYIIGWTDKSVCASVCVYFMREREREWVCVFFKRESVCVCFLRERESLIWRHCRNHLSEKAVFTINSFLLTVKTHLVYAKYHIACWPLIALSILIFLKKVESEYLRDTWLPCLFIYS